MGQYVDFDLSIWAEGDGYVAKVTDSPAGQSERVRVTKPFPDISREELLLRLENAVLRGQGLHRGSPEEKVLREFGAEVFKIVFKAPAIERQFISSLNKVKEQQGEVEGLRLKLRVEPPELALLPWEYVYDDFTKTYLCLRNQSPLVRFLEVPEPTPPLIVKGPLNVLGMISNPGGGWPHLDAERERTKIDKAMASLKDKRVNFRWVQGDTYEHLLEMMQKDSWHVFHFIGHGGTGQFVDPDSPQSAEPQSDGFIVLSDGSGGAVKVPAFELGLALQGDGSLRLAVLNCCESGRSSGHSAFSSAGAALVQAGVPVVVAMQFPITDSAAIQFTSGFYSSLVTGAPVERAITTARVAMRYSSNVEWGIPVLFTRAKTSTLFTVERPNVGAAEPETGTVAPERTTRTSAQEELRRLYQ